MAYITQEIEHKVGDDYQYIEFNIYGAIVSLTDDYGQQCYDVEDISWDRSLHCEKENNIISEYIDEHNEQIVYRFLSECKKRVY